MVMSISRSSPGDAHALTNLLALVMGNTVKSSLGRKDDVDTVRFEAKEESFIRNGAVLLEKQISGHHGRGMSKEPLRIFSARVIEHAITSFDPPVVLGRGIAAVYKGVIEDRPVAIKVPYRDPPTRSMTDFFLNQVVVKQMISHTNAARLYGCCLETPEPILVYEFLQNGTLYHRLHEPDTGWLSWSDRVRIAQGSASALCYMHCGMEKPIVHLDVKSANIFLDEFFTAKLSNFGFAVSISPGEVFRSMDVEGSWGYVDPEYARTRHVTDKCDVYSFGVVLLELVTNVDPARCHLVHQFHSFGMVHDRVREEGTEQEVEAFVGVALRCVAGKGEERPSMQEVALELKRIQRLVSARLRSLPDDGHNTQC